MDPRRGGRCQFTRSNGQVHNRGSGTLRCSPHTGRHECATRNNAVDGFAAGAAVVGVHRVRGVRRRRTGRETRDGRGGRVGPRGEDHDDERGHGRGYHGRRGDGADRCAEGRVHHQADQQGQRRRFVHVRVRGVGRQLQSGKPRRGGQRERYVRVRGRVGTAKAGVVFGQQLVRLSGGWGCVAAAAATAAAGLVGRALVRADDPAAQEKGRRRKRIGVRRRQVHWRREKGAGVQETGHDRTSGTGRDRAAPRRQRLAQAAA